MSTGGACVVPSMATSSDVGDGPIHGLDDVCDGVRDVIIGVIAGHSVVERVGWGVVVGVRRERRGALLGLNGELSVRSRLRRLSIGFFGVGRGAELPF
jgi:hypothetical protein